MADDEGGPSPVLHFVCPRCADHDSPTITLCGWEVDAPRRWHPVGDPERPASPCVVCLDLAIPAADRGYCERCMV